jgi:hypothetical protein
MGYDLLIRKESKYFLLGSTFAKYTKLTVSVHLVFPLFPDENSPKKED